MKNTIHANKGSSLIEVLIALIILSYGMLGISGLQSKTQQFNRGAYYNSKATFFAHDMLENIRANAAGKRAGYYNNPSPLKTPNCYTTTGCSPENMAKNDMYEWKKRVQNSLPNSNAAVCIDSTPDDGTSSIPECDGVGSVYAIKIWWQMNTTFKRIAISTAF